MTKEKLYYLPASELLKHIQAEKERLIKEKIIKKSKPLPPITDNEKPYELPNGWEWVRLGDYTKIITDYVANGSFATLRENVNTYQEKEYALFIRTKDFSNNFSKDLSYIDRKSYEFLAKSKLYGGELILSNIGSIGKCFIVPNFNIPMSLASNAIMIDNYIELSNKYLYFLFSSPLGYELLFNISTGTTMLKFNKTDLRNVVIPLPPLYIQDQIIQKLEKLSETKDSLLSHSEFQSTYTKKMREALLQEAIRGELVPQNENDESASVLLEKIKAEKEELRLSKNARRDSVFPEIEPHEIPFKIPSHWKWVRIGEIGIYKKGPFGSALKKSLFVPKGEDTVKVFEQKNAIQKDITLGDYYISKDYFETNMTGFEVFPGDILVSCAGTIGETYVVPENSEKGIINQALMKMNIVKSVNLNYFLYYFDFILKNTAQESSKGSAIKNIPPFDVFKKLLFPLPPLAEQERIVAKLDELMANCDQLEAKAQEMKNYTTKLFEASLKEAFMPE